MGERIFDQLNFLRMVTLHTVKDVSEREALIIPPRFNNHILWNLGHIYAAQEHFAFRSEAEPGLFPEGFAQLFAKDSKPADWTVEPPSLGEIINLLQDQPERIREYWAGRLSETSDQPFTIPGLVLEKVDDLLAFTLYHEGIHVQAIKSLLKFIR